MKHLKFFIFLCFLTFTISCGQQKKYIQYKVKEGETMSKIAQKLNMKTADLKRLNPDVKTEPRKNSFIVVPEKKLINYKNNINEDDSNNDKKDDDVIVIDDDAVVNETDSINKDRIIEEFNRKFEIYEIKKGDTFFNLSKRFQVSRAELLLLNPELKEGLKLGQIIKLREVFDKVEEDSSLYIDEIQPRINLKATILLPFMAGNGMDTLSGSTLFSKQGSLLNIVTDFYLGAEMAVDSLRKQGVNVDLSVFDTGGRNNAKLRSILGSSTLNSSDVIFGPLYSENVQLVANNVRVPVVFPVYSKNQNQFTADNIIKTAPDVSVYRETLTEYVKDNFIEGNIIIVSDDDFSSIQSARFLESSLSSVITIPKIHILSPEGGYIKKSRFLELLKPNQKNWVILAADKYLTISDAINSLISLPEETEVKVFSIEVGKSFKQIDHRKLAKIGFTYVTDEFPNNNENLSDAFIASYSEKNNALPSSYATKGFDITYDILMRLASGKKLSRTFKNGTSYRVDSKFNYIENRSDVFENRGVFLVQYNKDLTLTRLK